MLTIWTPLSILGGFVALIAGGELLVRGATKLALVAKVSPLVIGLTIVAFGTSAPELAVSVKFCLAGKTGGAIGNAVGSNISNILFILGASAIVVPLSVHARLFRLDIPVMIAAVGALWALGGDGAISRVDGVLFCCSLIAYFVWTVRTGRRESRLLTAELGDLTPKIHDPETGRVFGHVLVLGGGLTLLVLGSDWLVSGCVALAEWAQISKLVIGLTVVAIGTSLPELVTSLVAAMRGQRDLAVGNVVGSNILNMLGVLGISAMVAPEGIPVEGEPLNFHIPVMVAVSLLCLPVFRSGFSIERWEGVAMLAGYVAYLVVVVYAAVNALPLTFQSAAIFSAPMIALTIVALFWGRRNSRWRR